MKLRRLQLALLALTVLLTGCHKKVRVTVPPPAPLVLPPEPLPPPTVNVPAETPAPATPPPTTPAPTPTPAAPPRRAVTRPTPTPAPKPTPTDPLGNLSAGDSTANPQLRAQAAALIADIDKRLAALPATTRQQKRTGLSQVQNFLQQAKDALSSGDPEGANNLATKSKLLLDDLLK